MAEKYFLTREQFDAVGDLVREHRGKRGKRKIAGFDNSGMLGESDFVVFKIMSAAGFGIYHIRSLIAHNLAITASTDLTEAALGTFASEDDGLAMNLYEVGTSTNALTAAGGDGRLIGIGELLGSHEGKKIIRFIGDDTVLCASGDASSSSGGGE